MKSLLPYVTDSIREEEGASAVEYAILVAVIAAVIVIITVIVGYQVEGMFNKLCKALIAISNNACA